MKKMEKDKQKAKINQVKLIIKPKNKKKKKNSKEKRIHVILKLVNLYNETSADSKSSEEITKT